jgi:hypothetical protein
MATGENCYGLGNAINRLDNVGSERNAAFDASKAARGEKTLNDILQPIRNAREAEKTATGAEKARLMDEIHSHYAEGKSPGSKTTKATQDISKAIQSDSDVQQYIRNMSPSEFGKARTEIKNTFGGDQARMMEHQYVNKMDDYEAALESSGKMIPSIKERIATTRSRGVMSDSDLDVMRGLEEYLSLGDDAFARGKSRGTYNSLGRKLGDDITQDIFETKISDNLDKIAQKAGNQNILDSAFGKSLSDDEKKLLEDYGTGKIIPDANTLETTAAMLRKMDQNTLSAMRNAVEPLDELPFRSRTGVMEKAKKSKISKAWDGTGKATKGAIAATGLGLTVMYGIPQTLLWYATSTQTNIAEMTGLYEQFKADNALTSDLDRGLLSIESLARINEFLSNLMSAEDRYPYKLFLGIPIYGDYVRSYLADGMGDTQTSIAANFGRLFEQLESRGLTTRDSSTLGWRATTEDERKEIFKNTPEKLFKNDGEFIEENAPWDKSTGVWKGTTELSPAAVMALYLGQSDAYSKLGVSNSDLNDPAFADKVKQYGEANDSRGTGTPSAQGATTAITEQDLYEEAIAQRMRKYNESQEDAKVVVDRELTGLMTKNGGDAVAALAQMTGKAVSGNYRGGGGAGTTTTAGGGGSGDSGEKSKKTLSGEVGVNAAYMKEHGTNSVDFNRQKQVVAALSDKGKVDIEAVKEKAGMSVTEMLSVDEAGTKAGFKDHVKQQAENENRIDKTDYTQMRENDKQAARDAARTAVGCT